MNKYDAILIGACLPACIWISACAPRQAAGPQLGRTDPPANRKAGLEKLARTDHIALLESCLANYDARYKGYTCTFIKQERMGGVLGKRQTVAVKFMDSPFSVGMKWLENPLGGDRVLYVEGKYGGHMLVRPTGLGRWFVSTAKRRPDGPDVMKSTLRPVTLFGFKRAMQSLLEVYRRARSRGELKQEFEGYAQLAGRGVIVLVRRLPDSNEYRPAAPPVTRIYIDLEYLVPTMIEGFEAGGKKLLARYQYRGVNFNAGLTARDFRPEKFDLKDPG